MELIKIDSPDYTVRVKIVFDKPIIHCDVYSWNKNVAKELYNVFVKIEEELIVNGFNEMYALTPNPKFAEMYGGESISVQDDYEVMKWDLIR